MLPGATAATSLLIWSYTSAPVSSASFTRSWQNWSLNHFKERPAAWVTPIICHAPGTAQQQVWILPFGSMAGLLVWANTTPEVPMVVKAVPSFTTPVPTAAAALSPAPPATIHFSERPVLFATSASNVPVASQDSYTFPKRSLSIFNAFSTSSDQQRPGTSKSCIPLASETSVANTPVSM